MLSFAVEYRKAVARMTADQELGLRKFELNSDEWRIVEQLTEVLKVRH